VALVTLAKRSISGSIFKSWRIFSLTSETSVYASVLKGVTLYNWYASLLQSIILRGYVWLLYSNLQGSGVVIMPVQGGLVRKSRPKTAWKIYCGATKIKL